MQRGVERTIGVVLNRVRFCIAELVLRMEARELEFRGVAEFGCGGFGGG